MDVKDTGGVKYFFARAIWNTFFLLLNCCEVLFGIQGNFFGIQGLLLGIHGQPSFFTKVL